MTDQGPATGDAWEIAYDLEKLIRRMEDDLSRCRAALACLRGEAWLSTAEGRPVDPLPTPDPEPVEAEAEPEPAPEPEPEPAAEPGPVAPLVCVCGKSYKKINGLAGHKRWCAKAAEVEGRPAPAAHWQIQRRQARQTKHPDPEPEPEPQKVEPKPLGIVEGFDVRLSPPASSPPRPRPDDVPVSGGLACRMGCDETFATRSERTFHHFKDHTPEAEAVS